MLRRDRPVLFAAPRPGGTSTRFPYLVQALALIGLFTLPVQMRAGTEHSHPHALFQLLLDARDGVIDHHFGQDEEAHQTNHQRSYSPSAAQHPDLPALGSAVQTGGGLALLATLVFAVLLPSGEVERIWPPSRHWRQRNSIPEPPPPRHVSA
jgi:hypothetical protein